MSVKRGPWGTFVMSIVYLTWWGQLGVLTRVYLDRLVVLGCQAGNWGPCWVTGGAPDGLYNLYTSVTVANILGCFIIGVLSPAPLLDLGPQNSALLPPNSSWQQNTLLLIGMRTGYCGCLTTFASFMEGLVVTGINYNRYLDMVFGMFIGVQTSLASVLLGQSIAMYCHRLWHGETFHLYPQSPKLEVESTISAIQGVDRQGYEQSAVTRMSVQHSSCKQRGSRDPTGPPFSPARTEQAPSGGPGLEALHTVVVGGAAAVHRRTSSSRVGSGKDSQQRTPLPSIPPSGQAAENITSGTRGMQQGGNAIDTSCTAEGPPVSCVPPKSPAELPAEVAERYKAEEIESTIAAIECVDRQGYEQSASDRVGDADVMCTVGDVPVGTPNGSLSSDTGMGKEAVVTATLGAHGAELAERQRIPVWLVTATGGVCRNRTDVAQLVLCVCTALLFLLLVILYDHGQEHQQLRTWFMAVVLSPPGCILRWQLGRLNFQGQGFWKYFPSGTFAANMLGTAITLGLQCISQRRGSALGYWGHVLVDGFQQGFCGSLTTVSTWAFEILGQLRLVRDGVLMGYLYMLTTLAGALVLGFTIYGWSVWA